MVHPIYSFFLTFYLAHLLSDFVFGTGRLVMRGHRRQWRGYVAHCAIHYLTACAIVSLADPRRVLAVGFQLVVVSLSPRPLLVDWMKMSLARSRRIESGALSFALSQAAHAAAVVGAVLFLAHSSLQTLAYWLALVRPFHEKILLVAVVYTAVIFGGGHFIRQIISPLWKEEPGQETEGRNELINAGLYIGWLERFLALTALFLQSPATVGFILAAKSIARYPELKSVRFAEYFLIGTLLSMAFAIAGAIILLKALHGAVVLGK